MQRIESSSTENKKKIDDFGEAGCLLVREKENAQLTKVRIYLGFQIEVIVKTVYVKKMFYFRCY